MTWFQNFEKNWNKLKSQYDERFYRMWKYYLMAVAASFRSHKNGKFSSHANKLLGAGLS
jgi:cyclopropane-fatty-acyl-phospholipid synthase